MGITTRDDGAVRDLCERIKSLEQVILDLTTGLELLEHSVGENMVVTDALATIMEEIKRNHEDDDE